MRVSFTVNRFFVLINLYLLTHFAHSQKTHSIQLLAIPFTHQIGNMQNMYVKHSESFIYADYIKNSWPEFGLAYRHGFNNKWDINTGLSLQFATYKMSFRVYYPEPLFPMNPFFIKYVSANQNNLNLRLGFGYTLTEKIKINFCTSFNAGIWYEANPNFNKFHQEAYSHTTWITPDTTYHTYDFSMNMKFEQGNFEVLSVVPEISASFNIVENLNLLVGFRFKFWNPKYNFYYRATVTGFVGDENKGTNSILHESSYTSKDYSIYFGLTYDIFLKERRKNK